MSSPKGFKFTCAFCHAVNNAQTALNQDNVREPETNDMMLCVHCGEVALLKEDGTLSAITLSELLTSVAYGQVSAFEATVIVNEALRMRMSYLAEKVSKVS